MSPREPEWWDFAAAGVVEAAIEAADLALKWRAGQTSCCGAASRVRAKRADRVLDALLREDAVTPASLRGKLSERAARRLFDRLCCLAPARVERPAELVISWNRGCDLIR